VEDRTPSSGANPADLDFKITETALMSDIENGHAFAHGIVQLGGSLALYDFGTGYGTFTHVKKLPIVTSRLILSSSRNF
jgi:predicted signal transduction protein with EAL and GGDEF domain